MKLRTVMILAFVLGLLGAACAGEEYQPMATLEQAQRAAESAERNGDFARAEFYYKQAKEMGSSIAQDMLDQLDVARKVYDLAHPEKMQERITQELLDDKARSLPVLERHVNWALDGFEKWAEEESKIDALCKVVDREHEARVREALALIGDDVRYPRDSKQKTGQSDVDFLVKQVEAVYRHSGDVAFLSKHAKFHEEYMAVDFLMMAYSDCGGSAMLVKDRYQKAMKKLDEAVSLEKRMRAKYADVLEENRSFKHAGFEDNERKAAELINSYRMMMRKPPLRLHGMICDAAQGHSDDMIANNYYGHYSKDESIHSAKERIIKTGYEWGAHGEILMEMNPDPAEALRAWQNSAGHHRCMLDTGDRNAPELRFVDMGVGFAEKETAGETKRYWTVNFATTQGVRREK